MFFLFVAFLCLVRLLAYMFPNTLANLRVTILDLGISLNSGLEQSHFPKGFIRWRSFATRSLGLLYAHFDAFNEHLY